MIRSGCRELCVIPFLLEFQFLETSFASVRPILHVRLQSCRTCGIFVILLVLRFRTWICPLISRSGLLFVKPEMADRQSSGEGVSSSGRDFASGEIAQSPSALEPSIELIEVVDGIEVVGEVEPSRPRGVGKGLMTGHKPLSSDEDEDDDDGFGDDDDDEGEGDGGEEGNWDGIMREQFEEPEDGEEVPQKPKKKVRMDPSSKAREGHPIDKDFPHISVIPPKKKCRDIVWAREEFYPELVRVEYRGRLRPEVLTLVPPSADDRAHDHEKGMCVFWKMPKCGFRLPITDFQRRLLTKLDITPSQLTSSSWCTISSFEGFFERFKEELEGAAPTAGLFGHFFMIAVLNDSLLFVKKKQGGTQIFSDKNKHKKKVESWKNGWVYIPNPSDVFSLEGIRTTWRPFEVNRGPVLPRSLTIAEVWVAEKIKEIVASWASCLFLYF